MAHDVLPLKVLMNTRYPWLIATTQIGLVGAIARQGSREIAKMPRHTRGPYGSKAILGWIFEL
jgi:hypothetical protein